MSWGLRNRSKVDVYRWSVALVSASQTSGRIKSARRFRNRKGISLSVSYKGYLGIGTGGEPTQVSVVPPSSSFAAKG